MRKLHKGLIAGAIGLAVLVPGGIAVADQSPTTPTPVCTQEQRAERWAARDQLRTQILDQLAKEGVTDPVQVREQLQTRLHDAMEQQFGEMNRPNGAMKGAGMGQGRGQHTGPMDGSGFGHGRNAG